MRLRVESARLALLSQKVQSAKCKRKPEKGIVTNRFEAILLSQDESIEVRHCSACLTPFESS